MSGPTRALVGRLRSFAGGRRTSDGTHTGAPEDAALSAAAEAATLACRPVTESRPTPTRVVIAASAVDDARQALDVVRFLALDHRIGITVILAGSGAVHQRVDEQLVALGARVVAREAPSADAIGHERAVAAIGAAIVDAAATVVLAIGGDATAALDAGQRCGVATAWWTGADVAARVVTDPPGGAREDRAAVAERSGRPTVDAVLGRLDALVVPAPALAEAWIDRLDAHPIDDSRIGVVPIGIDTREADEGRFVVDRDELRADLGFSPDEVVLIVPSDHPDAHAAAVAAASAADRSTPWRLALFDVPDSGRDADGLRAAIVDADLADRVVPLPVVPDPERWAVAADAVVHLGDVAPPLRRLAGAMVQRSALIAVDHPALSGLVAADAEGRIVVDGDEPRAGAQAIDRFVAMDGAARHAAQVAAEASARGGADLVDTQRRIHRLVTGITTTEGTIDQLLDGDAVDAPRPVVRDGRGTPTGPAREPDPPRDPEALLRRWRDAPRRVLITDNWPTNAGDMAIALTTEDVLRAHDPDIAVVHAVYHHDAALADLDRVMVVPALEHLVGWPGRDPVESWAVIGDELVRSADLVLSQGGGFFTGHLESYGRLQALHEASSVARRFAIGGQTIGRYESARIRQLLRATMERAVVIGARDQPSIDALAELGVPADTVLAASDMVLARFPDPPTAPVDVDGPVTVFVTDTALVGPGVSDDDAEQVVVAIVERVMATTDRPVTLLSSVQRHGVRASQDDGPLIDAVLEQFAPEQRQRISLVDGPLSVDDLATHTRRSSAVVSMRFHPALFACLQGIPFALIQPGSKSRVLGDHGARVTRAAFDAAARDAAVEAALAADAPRGDELWASVAPARARTRRLVDALTEVLDACS